MNHRCKKKSFNSILKCNDFHIFLALSSKRKIRNKLKWDILHKAETKYMTYIVFIGT